VTVFVRTVVEPASIESAVRTEIQSIDPDLPVHDLRTLNEQIALAHWQLRVFGAMFSIFAGIALLLAMAGVYAIVAYDVNRRTCEIGLRMALGASRGGILCMVMARGMRPTAIGLILGLSGAFAISRLLGAVLVGTSPTDPITFTAAAGVLVATAVLGCLLPAYRAMTVQPAIALRNL
jgi:putative ABC transport system permease protein